MSGRDLGAANSTLRNTKLDFSADRQLARCKSAMRIAGLRGTKTVSRANTWVDWLFDGLRRRVSSRQVRRPRHRSGWHLRVEMLEGRRLLSANPTYVANNWALVNDLDGSNSLSVGDVV